MARPTLGSAPTESGLPSPTEIAGPPAFSTPAAPAIAIESAQVKELLNLAFKILWPVEIIGQAATMPALEGQESSLRREPFIPWFLGFWVFLGFSF